MLDSCEHMLRLATAGRGWQAHIQKSRQSNGKGPKENVVVQRMIRPSDVVNTGALERKHDANQACRLGQILVRAVASLR